MTLSQRIAEDGDASGGHHPRVSIRSLLLLGVNVPLLGLVGILLAYNYQREISERVESKRIALEEEARAILPGAIELRARGTAVVQRYIDTVCGQMQLVNSPDHHLVLELPEMTLQAQPHHLATPEMLTAVKSAAKSSNRRTNWNTTELIVGVEERNGVTVYVAESLANVSRAARAGAINRLIAIVVLFVVAGLIVNMILLQTVTHPIQTMVATLQRLARGQFGAQSKPVITAELNYLASEINRMSLALASADRDRKAQMDKAREIQQHLLPQAIEIPGINTAFVVHPAEDVGGDFCDVVSRPNGDWVFCIADVTGHGVPAAMSAAMLKLLFGQAAEQFCCPSAILDFINERLLFLSLEGDFVSMLVAQIASDATSFEYASAGHEPAWFVYPAGKVCELPSTGLLLGIDSEATWTTEKVNVAHGGRLFMISDGVVEAFNERGECFGRRRFADLCARSMALAVHESLTQISVTLAEHQNGMEQGDDVTIVVVEFTSR
jgi:sigma-B regulation protein RsbU (phosphoserine phosphatase)